MASLFTLKVKRGQEIRKIESHVKGVIVLGLTKRGHRVVIGARLGKAYSDERKLFLAKIEESLHKGIKDEVRKLAAKSESESRYLQEALSHRVFHRHN